MPQTMERTQEVLRDVFDNPDVVLRREMTAYDVEGWNSLSHIQLIVALEKTFAIKFKAAEVMAVKNVGELLDLIEKKRSA